ncbi:MAG: hypothetical protein IPM51_08520 [Sphingobacteriaceae bacterium]|nr:hypothetical protein [Sphingobacteriaceae bacterium]
MINYQGVSRNGNGEPVAGTFTLTVEILNSGLVYTENHIVTSNSLGLFSIKIGGGNQTSAQPFSAINWANGPYYLRTSLNTGSGNVNLGTQQLVSVPYALYAETSGSAISPSLQINGNNLSITGGNTVTLPSATVASSPQTSLTGSGIASVTPVGTNSFNIFVPFTNISGTGATTVTGTFPNYTISSLNNSSPTMVGTGISTVITLGNNYTVATSPVGMNYNPVTGILSYSPSPGISTLNVNPTLNFTNNILSVGANSVTIPGTGLWSKPNATVTSLTNGTDWLGIGNTNPLTKVDVSSNGNNFIGSRSLGFGYAGFLIDRASSAEAGYLIYRDNGNDFWTVGTHTNSSNYMIFNWANTRPDLSINFTNGFAGFGTTSPTENLQIENSGATPVRLSIISTNTSAIWFGNPALHSKGLILYDNVTNEMNFGTNNFTSRLRLYGNGDASFSGAVGIGTNTPASELDVNGTILISGVNTNELNRTQTGNANLVPIAYGTSNSSGILYAASTTTNVSLVSHTPGSGVYTFAITGESINFSTYNIQVSLVGGSGEISFNSLGGNLIVNTYNSDGTVSDKQFSFLVFKK